MLNVASFLPITRSSFTKEKRETTLEDPVNKFALELLCQIFSYLPLKDFVRASEVSKNWQAFINQNIHDFRFKPLCLYPKSESISWKTHYIQLENLKRRVAKQNPQPITLQSISTPNLSAHSRSYQALLCDQINGFACLVIVNNSINDSKDKSAKIECNEFQIWDLKNDKLMKTIRSTVSELKDMAFGYPYLLTKANKNVFIRDVSSDSDEPIHTVSTLKYGKDFFINKFGFLCSNINIKAGSRTIYADLIFYQIKKESLEFYALPDCGFGIAIKLESEKLFPISLLSDNKLIYEITPGILTVRDITKEGFAFVAEQLCSPELEEKKDEFSSMNLNQVAKTFVRNKVTSVVTRDNILATLSMENLLIWNLESGQLIKSFTRPDPAESTSILCDSSLKLDAISGHTLIAHTSSAFHVLDISGNEITTLKEWENTNEDNYAYKSIGYYQEKFYMLAQNEDLGHDSITLFDYSNK